MDGILPSSVSSRWTGNRSLNRTQDSNGTVSGHWNPSSELVYLGGRDSTPVITAYEVSTTHRLWVVVWTYIVRGQSRPGEEGGNVRVPVL